MTWKLQIPLLRCPFCRHWVQIVNRGEWKATRPSNKLLERLQRDQNAQNGQQVVDSPASVESQLSRTRVREEVENDG